MCSMYWNLGPIDFTCPKCGQETHDTLQTHFMGEAWSCTHYYALGEPVPEMLGITVTLDGRLDDFSADCPECGAFVDFAAEIVDGKVIRVWPYQYWQGQETVRVA